MGIVDILLVMASGLVFAGVVHSLWKLLSGSEVRFGLLLEANPLFALRAMVVVTSAPLLLFHAGLHKFAMPGGKFPWWLAFAAAIAWCFIQGVVVVVSLRILG